MEKLDNIVEMRDICIDYQMKKYDIRAVTNVNLNIKRGKITALVGESGSGKTTLASSLIQCISSPGKLVKGSITFFEKSKDGDNKQTIINEISSKDINHFRWAKISMVFQAAQSALNPVMTVREQFLETLQEHDVPLTKEEKEKKCIELLEYVKLDAIRVLESYPHELSGGMKQRVMIAFALILDPELIILDEPTTALDVITQNYIFNLLKQINRDMGISMLLMTHDISVVAKFADYVGVMYGGRLMEYGNVYEIFGQRLHPYTDGLINATPSIVGSIDRMKPIAGVPPDLMKLPSGCVFSPRCPKCADVCKINEPPTVVLSEERCGKCYLFEGYKDGQSKN